tara:strand:+ start:45 stop:287 length:243 start_codon:yes stop_codon:yes gene_type:complete
MDYLKDFKKEIKENEDYEKRQSEFFETLEKKHSIQELGSTNINYDPYDELDESCDRECCDWRLDPIEFGYKDANINTIDW